MPTLKQVRCLSCPPPLKRTGAASCDSPPAKALANTQHNATLERELRMDTYLPNERHDVRPATPPRSTGIIHDTTKERRLDPGQISGNFVRLLGVKQLSLSRHQ